MSERTENEILVDLAVDAVTPTPTNPGTLHVQVVRDDAHLVADDYERFLRNPTRSRGAVTLHTSASLVAYVNRFAAEAVSLYADLLTSTQRPTITAVLNGHTADTPGWGDHRAAVAFQMSRPWLLWVSQDRKWLSQRQFAEHVEEGQIDIIEPPAADMLELAQTLQAKNAVNFRSQDLLANGQRQFTYEETVEARAGEKGKLTVPAFFRVGLPVFDGATQAYMLTARLQFRLESGHLTFRYLLDRPEDVVRSAFDDEVKAVEHPVDAGGCGVAAYRGAAPQPLHPDGR